MLLEILAILMGNINHCSGKFLNCQSILMDFLNRSAYTVKKTMKGGRHMRDHENVEADVDDLIFADEEYYPSER